MFAQVLIIFASLCGNNCLATTTYIFQDNISGCATVQQPVNMLRDVEVRNALGSRALLILVAKYNYITLLKVMYVQFNLYVLTNYLGNSMYANAQYTINMLYQYSNGEQSLAIEEKLQSSKMLS